MYTCSDSIKFFGQKLFTEKINTVKPLVAPSF